jgi:hypothetical protein
MHDLGNKSYTTCSSKTALPKKDVGILKILTPPQKKNRKKSDFFFPFHDVLPNYSFFLKSYENSHAYAFS